MAQWLWFHSGGVVGGVGSVMVVVVVATMSSAVVMDRQGNENMVVMDRQRIRAVMDRQGAESLVLNSFIVVMHDHQEGC